MKKHWRSFSRFKTAIIYSLVLLAWKRHLLQVLWQRDWMWGWVLQTLWISPIKRQTLSSLQGSHLWQNTGQSCWIFSTSQIFSNGFNSLQYILSAQIRGLIVVDSMTTSGDILLRYLGLFAASFLVLYLRSRDLFPLGRLLSEVFLNDVVGYPLPTVLNIR